ncbi:MAG: nucleotide exchange factor GrpE [Clostridium sp.]|uniref:nucleotide exchange factor GrpE n=1 Tax=Clostridium sp. TaxID=1506 RepID=UPI003F37F553
MEGINLEKEFKEYKKKYLQEKSSLENLLDRKDFNDVLSDRERLIKKELLKFERLEQAYRDKIDSLELDLIRRDKELKEVKKGFRKTLNSVIEILDEIDNFKELLEEREDKKTLKTFSRTIKGIDKKINYIGLERIKTISEQFNEDFHYCVEVVENNEFENETIIEEVKSGYRYKGNVVRESKVVVIKNEGRE